MTGIFRSTSHSDRATRDPDAAFSLSPSLPASPPPTAAPPRVARPQVHGKFFRRGDEKLYLRGMTYGPFRPGADGEPYDPPRVRDDFARMAAAGVNTIRVYTPPPEWLLDSAADHGLLVLAGLAWEQHVTFLDDRGRAAAIAQRVTEEISRRAGHPALLAWAVGNEIPAPVVRWHGARAVRRFLMRLHDAAKQADPETLVTYVNYPSTEYLDLDFLDFTCFNVFLERPAPFASYVDRLQNLAADRPLVLTEIGLDSASHGQERQADLIEAEVRAAFAAGCAGAYVFSWTDEWHRGGAEIEEWQFGVTDRARAPKPALERLRQAFAEVPLTIDATAPRISVVICTYNGARTLGETCAAVARLDYPNAEVIVVDDGSTDASAAIAAGYGFQVISTHNEGLSSARNRGLEAATGEIVAFLDDDAAPDPHWLTYIAGAFMRSDVVAAGGPNLPVAGDGAIADAVAAAPGNPIHVLISDREAEHIPGCNAAFRVDALRAIGGFDPRFRAAGDDVDVCWRLLDRGWTIGYVPGAFVWHHRRTSVTGYLRQQRGYGAAEALLENKWPERYSAGGHVTWRGRVYGDAAPRHSSGPLRERIYHGVWGTAAFQSIYEPARGNLNAVALMPEAYLAIGCLALIVALGSLWSPLFALAPLLVAAAGVIAWRAVAAAATARFPSPALRPADDIARRLLTAVLHLMQPIARLDGRLRHGLSPWRRRPAGPVRAAPVPRSFERWSEEWLDPVERVQRLERELVAHGAVVRRGGSFDDWDLETRGGTLAGARLWTVVEEHGGGRQLVRMRCRATWSRWAIALCALLLGLCGAAAANGAFAAAAILAGLAAALTLRLVGEASTAVGLAVAAIGAVPTEP